MHQDPVTKSQRLTDFTGGLQAVVDLDPWGGETGRCWQQGQQSQRYTSYERDGNGNDQAMFRQYHSYWQRFDQPDPYDGSYDGTDPQSLNRYAYVQNDPVNYVDPTGLNATSGGAVCASGYLTTIWYGHSGDWRIISQTLECDEWADGEGSSGGSRVEQPSTCERMARDAQRIAEAASKGANAWTGTSAAAILQQFNKAFGKFSFGTYIGEGMLGSMDAPMRLHGAPNRNYANQE